MTASDPDGNTFTATSSATVNLTYTASLQVSKTADKTSAFPGDAITYTYEITNAGNVTISGITLKDSNLKLGDQGQISLSQTTLAPGENITATATYTVAETDLPGPLTNTATITGTDPKSNQVTASATATVGLGYNPRP